MVEIILLRSRRRSSTI